MAWARYEPTTGRQSRSSTSKDSLTQRTNRWSHHRPHDPAHHRPAPLLDGHEIGDGASAQRDGTAGADAAQKAKCDQRTEAVGERTGDVEDQKDEVTHVVDDLAAVQLRQRCNNQRPERVADQIYCRDEGTERFVGRVERVQHFCCCWRYDSRRERAA